LGEKEPTKKSMIRTTPSEERGKAPLRKNEGLGNLAKKGGVYLKVNNAIARGVPKETRRGEKKKRKKKNASIMGGRYTEETEKGVGASRGKDR